MECEQCRGDSAEWILLLAPQARGCCLTQGSIAIWTKLAAKCGVLCAHVCLFFSECVFVCKSMYVLICVCADVSPWQLLFLVVHFYVACDVTQRDTTTSAREACHKLICFLLQIITVASKGISIC